jgi:hypothetical protein
MILILFLYSNLISVILKYWKDYVYHEKTLVYSGHFLNGSAHYMTLFNIFVSNRIIDNDTSEYIWSVEVSRIMPVPGNASSIRYLLAIFISKPCGLLLFVYVMLIRLFYMEQWWCCCISIGKRAEGWRTWSASTCKDQRICWCSSSKPQY